MVTGDVQKWKQDLGGAVVLARELEVACYNHGVRHCRRSIGYVNSHARLFLTTYAQTVIRILCAVSERVVAVEDVTASPEVVAPLAAGPYAAQASGRLGARVEWGDSRFVTCKCGSQKVKYTEIQTGGTDEAMSYLYHCSHCMRQWRR